MFTFKGRNRIVQQVADLATLKCLCPWIAPNKAESDPDAGLTLPLTGTFQYINGEFIDSNGIYDATGLRDPEVELPDCTFGTYYNHAGMDGWREVPASLYVYDYVGAPVTYEMLCGGEPG